MLWYLTFLDLLDLEWRPPSRVSRLATAVSLPGSVQLILNHWEIGRHNELPSSVD